jgi:predicted enzyme related to lactoylglutathione lyase
MPERDGYADGVPSWTDLGTTDVEDAKRFYKAVFDWDAMDVPGGESMPYTMLSKAGKMVAGLGGMTPEQIEAGYPATWSTYIAVDDVDATLEKISEAGGSVVMPAMDAMGTGRMAFAADPTGAAFGMWQAGTHRGAQLVNEHGTLTWNELITDDAATATTFYETVFGYRSEVTDMPTGQYTTFWAEGNVEGNAAAGMMGKTDDMGDVPNYWGVYFAVDDVDESVRKVKDAGGVVLTDIMSIPEMGRMAVVADPQGAAFTVIEYSTPQK